MPHSAVPLAGHRRAAPPAAGVRPASDWPAGGGGAVSIAAPARTAGAAPSVDAAPRTSSGRAGSLPVTVGAAPRAGTVARFQVRLADRTATLRAAVGGVLFSVTGAGASSVALDYRSFRNAGGAGWADRVRLVRLPACALTTPSRPACQVQTALRSTNDTAAGTVSAPLGAPSGSGPVVLAAVAGSSGSNGDFSASSLAPSGTWSVSTASGAFSWAYQIPVPPAAAGSLAPVVALSYNSAAVDGRIASTNNQPSWVGEGWDYSPGFVERTYRGCADDPAGTAPKTGDLCWAGQIVTLNLGGQSTPLVLDDSSQTWRPASDNGERVELLTGGGNGAHNGEYWRVTRPDGTQYYFGREHGPGWTTQPTTHSTWTVPVYGAHTGDPCHSAAGFAASSCAQAWRWNLDYVEDPHGNAAAYYYNTEPNYYGANNATTGVAYTRGGTLDHIDYGLRDVGGSVYGSPAPDQVTFATSPRCTAANCDFTAANATNWPDTPQDQQCTQGATCNNHAPTFWSTRRLTTIATQYRAGTAYQPVDSYALGQNFPTAGDPELWLSSITRTGYAPDGSGTTSALPPVSFAGQLLANRVFGFNSQPEMLHWRLTGITAETGAVTAVTYTQPECTATNVPASPAGDTKRCFPVFWELPFQSTPTLDYFHKYLTAEVDVQEPSAISPTQITTYKYLGDPAWHQDDNEVVKPANRTYGQFRGYGQVEVRTGNVANSQGGVPDALTLTRTTYFRGMNGAPVTDSLGNAVPDDEAFADTVREEQTFNGATGTEVGATINDPTTVATTASRARAGLPALLARVTGIAKTSTVTDLADGTTRTGSVSNRYDSSGRLVAATDSADGLPDICTTRTYADNASSWIRDHVTETITSKQACPAPGTAPAPILTDARTYYDGSTTLGQVTGAGDPTRTENATDNTGGTLHFAVTTATYDAAGRPATSTVFTSAADTTGRTTSIAYTPAEGGPLTKVVTTNAKNQASTTTLDPGRGNTTETVDPNGRTTDGTYDPLGRLSATWLSGQHKGFDQPSLTYSYLIRGNGPLAVTTKRLVDPGGASNDTLHYVTSIDLYDALGQPRQTQTDAEGGGRVVADTFYDSHGWTVRTNNRWFTSGAPGTTLISTADSAVNSRSTTTYDGTGRPLQTTDYNGLTATRNTRTVYGGDRVTVVPPTGGVTTTTLTNARGQTTEEREYTTAPTINGNAVTGGTYQSTTYHYTALGQQDGITDPDNQQWTFAYDLADRKISQVDRDAGTSRFTYDDAGDVTSVTDGRGQTLAYSYDALGRRTGEYSGSLAGTQLASWTWDTARQGIGKLAFSTRFTPNGNYLVGVNGYNGDGLPSGIAVRIPASETGLAGTYTSSIGYTTTGLPAIDEPPSGGGLPPEVIGTTYTPMGNPKSTIGYGDYVDGTAYTPYSEPQQLALGINTSRATLTYDRDPQTRRVTNVNLSGPTATPQLDNLAYSYDPAGNITRKVDTLGGGTNPPVRTECYRYDALDRLTQAWTATDSCAGNPSSSTVGGPSPYWTSWSFDPAGLRGQQVRHALPGASGDTTTTYTYGTAGQQPHTLTSTTTTGPAGTSTASYTYDAAGNTATRNLPGGNQTLTWDAENRLAAVATPTGSTGYLYDADGNVLIRRSPTGTTLYLGDEELTRTPSGTVVGTRYYTHAGITVAVRTGSANQSFLLADQHGTNQVAADSGTFAVTRRLFDPYGNPVSSTGTWPDARGYLNAPTDTSTGLTDMGARKYDPTTGRFISADPQLDPTDSQSLNGYAYADGNPVTNADPTGLGLGCLDICVSAPRPGLNKEETGRTVVSTPAEHAKTGDELRAEGGLYAAKQHAADTKDKLLGIGKELVSLVADTLGITTGLECITGGGLSDCLQTAGMVLLSFAGGIAAKILSKYGLPWKWRAGARLVGRLWNLAHRAVDAVRDLLKARGEITDAERTLKAAEDAARNADLLDAARAARDARAGEVGAGKATVTGGYDPRSGRVASGCNKNPTGCAEDDVVRQLGVDPRDVRFTEAIRPRNGRQVAVCPVCQAKYDPQQFPPGTKFDPEGPWSLG